MKTTEMKKIRKAMEKCQDAKRFEHTLGVAYTAAALAMRYGESVKKAQLAGLLHDCAKCMSDEKKLDLCDKYNISITEYEKEHPYLLHAKVGSFLAIYEYHVDDDDIINAILNHTTGRPGMSLLEKIIYVADYIEPGRGNNGKVPPGLDEIRKMSFMDLDEALLRILYNTITYLKDTKGDLDEITQKTYDFYLERRKESAVGKE